MNASLTYEKLNEDFIAETKNFTYYMFTLKNECEKFDKTNPSQEDIEKFIEYLDKTFRTKIYSHFEKIWLMTKDLNKKTYLLYRSFYQKHLLSIFTEAEINKHIYDRPFGYPGDFVSMNYIYDFHNELLGKNTFEKFINHLTTTIPISLSNIKRKKVLKEKIIEIIKKNNGKAKITSIACGPAKEIIELSIETKLLVESQITFLDFEKKALDFVKKNLPPYIHAQFIHTNLIDLIKNKTSDIFSKQQDLIYAFGIYDYLNDLIAKKLTKILFQSLGDSGELFICNVAKEKESLRAYFEFLGEWEMIYRTKEQLKQLTQSIPYSKMKFIDDNENSYHFLCIIK